MNRLWSTLEVKSLDEDRREFTGIASTPTTDRMGDIVEPMGAEFKLPLPFLWQHDKDKPIGHVTSAAVTKKGIEIRGRIERAATSTVLKERLDEAWESIKLGLVRGLSIGFKPLEHSMMDDGGVRFVRWSWLETSAVTIAANQDASITAIKSIDNATIEKAALGRSVDAAVKIVSNFISPGASGKPESAIPPTPKRKGVAMNTREEIASYEATRAATVAAMDNLVAKAREDGQRSFDESEQQQFDEFDATIDKADKHLENLRKHEKRMISTAARIEPEAGKAPESVSRVPAGEGVLRPAVPLKKGTPFIRYAMALTLSKGNIQQAIDMAKQWEGSSPEVLNVLRYASSRGTTKLAGIMEQVTKAAVAAGTTTDTTWAAPLVQYNNMASEFIELLRPETILGKLRDRMRTVPFYVRIPRQTAGVTGYFVGEGAPKPLDSLAFDNLTMEPFKAACIVVITEELARFSSPDAENLIRTDMIRGVAQFLDERFIDPQYTGNASSPASITNGANSAAITTTTVAGTDAALETAITPFITANMTQAASLVWIMSPIVALSLSMKRNINDEYAYPGLTMNGGVWMNIPVITSNSAVLAGSPSEAIIVLLDASSVLYADGGGIDIDMSTEASVEMSDTPAGGATSLRSLWQNNLVGLRAEQFVNWKARRANPAFVLRYNLSPGAV